MRPLRTVPVILAGAASVGTDAYITVGPPADGEDLMARMLDAATHLLRNGLPGSIVGIGLFVVNAVLVQRVAVELDA